MFERFTQEARAVVVTAQLQARALGHDTIGTEHLLLAMLSAPTSPSGTLLAGRGLTLEAATATVQAFRGAGGPGGTGRTGSGDGEPDDLDAEALRAIGIDLDAVRASVEASFGEGALEGGGAGARGRRRFRPGGHLPFTPRAKKVLELGLREAIRLRHKEIRDLHLLLGILREGQGLAALVLTRAGIDLATLRQEIETRLSRAA